MHSDPTVVVSPDGVLALAFFGLLILGGLALFIYSIVAKRYWLTILTLTMPAGLVVVMGVISLNVVTSPMEEHTANLESLIIGDDPRLATRFPNHIVAPPTAPAHLSTDLSAAPLLADIAWSDDLQPTADIFPSIASAGRPLAFRIAESIRSEKRSQEKFAVTFAKEKRSGDRDQWKPPNNFVVAFRNEFMKQFPGSTVREPFKLSQQKAKAESHSDGRQPLEIKLSLTPENKNTGQQVAGSISARWTKPDDTRALESINFVNKPWVFDPGNYIAKRYTKRLSVGFSRRLARSPAEATTFALEDASRQGSNARRPIAPNQIVDSFSQKLTLPYGELWQASVLVDRSIAPSNSFQAPSTRVKEGTRLAQDKVSKGFTPTNGLILTTIGLIAIGWISNLLTQGYYRQNINYTIITGVVVLLGLLVLVVFAGLTGLVGLSP